MFLYNSLLKAGVAREVARFVLPQAAQTTMYMKGSVRSWIHYINLRTKPDTQKEHREIAEAVKQIFIEQFPIIAKALW
jgi:thymidylate synthase (FAD)